MLIAGACSDVDASYAYSCIGYDVDDRGRTPARPRWEAAAAAQCVRCVLLSLWHSAARHPSPNLHITTII